MITKTAEKLIQIQHELPPPDWEHLENDRYTARVVGGGLGGLSGGLAGRTAANYAVDHPKTLKLLESALGKGNAGRVNRAVQAIKVGVPLIGASVGGGMGTIAADASVRGAHFYDKFMGGVGARILGKERKNSKRSDLPELMAGATTSGAVGGASGYSLAKLLQSRTQAIPENVKKFRPRSLGKAGLLGAGVAGGHALLSRGILTGNQQAQRFFDLEDPRYIPAYKKNKEG